MVPDLLNEDCDDTVRFGVCCSGKEMEKAKTKLPRE